MNFLYAASRFRSSQVLVFAVMLIAGTLAQSSNLFGRDMLENGGYPAFDTAEIQVTGYVHDQAGVALENARVEAHDFQTGALLASAYTNGNGVFELTGLGRGLYEMIAISGVNEARQNVAINAADTVVDIRIAISDVSEHAASSYPSSWIATTV